MASHSFEVQIYQNKNWVMEAVCGNEGEAQELCKQLLGRAVEGVRILRESNVSGRITENVIFTKMNDNPLKDKIHITEISDAPYCNAADDYLSPTGRETIYRILRLYFEKMGLTPTEILYNHKELGRLLDFESLVPNAVGRVATLQAKASGVDVKTRRDELFAAIDAIQSKAREAGTRKDLPELKNKDFGALLAQIERTTAPQDIAHVALVVLSRDLIGCRSFLGKLEFLLELFSQSQQTRALAILDGIMADILRSPEVIQDLLGRQTSLANAINRLVDVVQGAVEDEDRGVPDATRTLSRLLRDSALPQTRTVLIEVVRRQVLGKSKLTHDEEDIEKAALKRIGHRLILNDAMLGGGPMADAITLRFQRFLGENSAYRNAVIGMLALFDVPSDKIRFLLALLDSEYGKAEPDAVGQQVAYVLRFCRGVNDLVERGLPLKTKLQSLTRLHRQMIAAALSDGVRKELAQRLDDMMAEYIIETKIIEKLDDPTASLRVRATRLVQFCDADNVIRGRSQALARDRVIGQLKQPNFDEKFVEDLADRTQHANALRNFHLMLTRAGFN